MTHPLIVFITSFFFYIYISNSIYHITATQILSYIYPCLSRSVHSFPRFVHNSTCMDIKQPTIFYIYIMRVFYIYIYIYIYTLRQTHSLLYVGAKDILSFCPHATDLPCPWMKGVILACDFYICHGRLLYVRSRQEINQTLCAVNYGAPCFLKREVVKKN